MTTFIQFPDTLDQRLGLLHFGHSAAPEVYPLPEHASVRNAVGLIPAHTITFGSLPRPGIRMSRKQNFFYLQQNIPSDLLYDAEHDKLLIWHSDKQWIVFAIVNQTLWEHWQKLLKNPQLELVSLIPEWMLLPWHNQPTPALSAAFKDYYLIRTSLWSGYSSPFQPQDDVTRTLALQSPRTGNAVNLKKMFSDLLRTPLPATLRYQLNLLRYLQYSKMVVCSFLIGIIIFQAAYLWQFHTRLQQLPEAQYRMAPTLGDIFSARLQEMQHASELAPFVLRTLDYKNRKLEISVNSFRPCEEVIASLQRNNLVVKILKSNTDNHQICDMTLEITP